MSRNGWQSPDAFWSVIAILIGIVLAAHVIVEKLGGVELPSASAASGWGVVHLAGGAIAFLFILIKWLNESTDYTAFGLYVEPHRRRRPGRRWLPDGEGGGRASGHPRWREGRLARRRRRRRPLTRPTRLPTGPASSGAGSVR